VLALVGRPGHPARAYVAPKIANQAYFDGNPSYQAILDTEARERGVRELIPPRAGIRR
jgi:hypothetical protein